MNASTEIDKIKIIDWLIHLKDIDVLRHLQALSEGHSVEDAPISKQQINDRAMLAEKQLENGQYKTNEQVKDIFKRHLK